MGITANGSELQRLFSVVLWDLPSPARSCLPSQVRLAAVPPLVVPSHISLFPVFFYLFLPWIYLSVCCRSIASSLLNFILSFPL